MSRTRRKLEEARFFYRFLEENRFANPAFDYYLSAFVSAARSVTWVMRAEYLGVQGWEQWFSTKLATPAEDALLCKVNEMRLRSVKTHPLEASAALIVHIPPEWVTPGLEDRLELGVGKRFKATIFEVAEDNEIQFPDGFPNNAIVGTVEGVERRVDEFPDEDVVNVCKRYLLFLEELVAECEANQAL